MQPCLAGMVADLEVILQRERRIRVSCRDHRVKIIANALHFNRLPGFRLIDVPVTQAQAGNPGLRYMGDDGQWLAAPE